MRAGGKPAGRGGFSDHGRRRPERRSCSPCRRAQKNPRRLKPRSNNPARCRVHAVLRQPHDHHRDLRARLRAEVPPHTAGSNQDRHVMMPSPLIYTYRSARHPCRLSAGTAQARITALHSIAVARPILSFYPQIARSHRRMRPCSAASRSRRPPQYSLSKPEPAAKSP